MWGPSLEHVNFPGATCGKKTNSSSLKTLTANSFWERGFSPICVEMLISLIHCRSWEGNHSCCEFMRAGNEGSTLVLPRIHCFSPVFPTSGSCNISILRVWDIAVLLWLSTLQKSFYTENNNAQFGVGAYPA